MDPGPRDAEAASIEGRPYRSHIQPACLPCRARKSRCKTGPTTSSCAMCLAHSTDCVFPQVSERRQRIPRYTRRNVSINGRHADPSPQIRRPSYTHSIRARCPSSTSPRLSQRVLQSYTTTRDELQHMSMNEATVLHREHSSPFLNGQGDSIFALMDVIAKSDEGSSHVVSPAIADDDRVFQEYLCKSPGLSRRMVRVHLNLNNPARHTRPMLFHVVPKRGQRETESRSLAASHCEIIEELIEPYQNDLIDL